MPTTADGSRRPSLPSDEAPITRRQLLRPDFGVRRRYRSGRGLSYGDHGLRNQLDVWKRADLPDDASAPVLLQIHGGAWVTGMKEGQGEPLMAHLAERGWVCVAANYRLSPRATWPDHIVDVKRALAWTKATIAEHGGDPSFVVITGGSAGGHLCSLAALTPNVADFQPGFEEVDTTVQAAVPFYGVYDFVNRHGTSRADMEGFLARVLFKSELGSDRARWEQASSISHVGPHAPPFFVLHGDHDSLVPVRAGPHLRRRAAQGRDQPGGVRGDPRRPACVRDVPVHPRPSQRPRRRAVPRRHPERARSVRSRRDGPGIDVTDPDPRPWWSRSLRRVPNRGRG